MNLWTDCEKSVILTIINLKSVTVKEKEYA